MTMNNDHPAWTQAKEALSQDDWDRLKSLFDVQSAVQDYLDSEAGIEVRNGTVFYEVEAIHNLVVEKNPIIYARRIAVQASLKFLGKLMENPSARSVNELYKFLEHKNMPLTSEGNSSLQGSQWRFQRFPYREVWQLCWSDPTKCVEMACVMMLMLDALAVSTLEAMSMPRDTPVGAVIWWLWRLIHGMS